jgi:hypothetical protein
VADTVRVRAYGETTSNALRVIGEGLWKQKGQKKAKNTKSFCPFCPFLLFLLPFLYP